jgi:hypothetical protein
VCTTGRDYDANKLGYRRLGTVQINTFSQEKRRHGLLQKDDGKYCTLSAVAAFRNIGRGHVRDAHPVSVEGLDKFRIRSHLVRNALLITSADATCSGVYKVPGRWVS